MSSPFLGEIRMFGFDFPPRGWANCMGQLLPISQNQALFSLLGTFYGGDGRQNFALPDLRSRTPISQSSSTPIGSVGGAENVTIGVSNLPAHTHSLAATTQTATKRPPAGRMFAADNASTADFYAAPAALVALDPRTVSTVNGSGQAHNNMQPFAVTNFSIALQGIFPSRN